MDKNGESVNLLCKISMCLSVFAEGLYRDVKKITRKRQKAVDRIDEFCYDAFGEVKLLYITRLKGRNAPLIWCYHP